MKKNKQFQAISCEQSLSMGDIQSSGLNLQLNIQAHLFGLVCDSMIQIVQQIYQ